MSYLCSFAYTESLNSRPSLYYHNMSWILFDILVTCYPDRQISCSSFPAADELAPRQENQTAHCATKSIGKASISILLTLNLRLMIISHGSNGRRMNTPAALAPHLRCSEDLEDHGICSPLNTNET